MVVLRVAVIVLVDGAAGEHHLAEQPRLHHLGERPVDRGPAGPGTGRRPPQAGEELLGVEVLVVTGDVIDDRLALPGDPLAAGAQELREPLPRRQRHLDGAERKLRRECHVPASCRTF